MLRRHSMSKRIPLLILLVILLLGGLLGVHLYKKFEARKVMSAQQEDAPDTVAAQSPDQKHVAYAFWENGGYSFYLLTGVGNPPELISRQHSVDGDGEVDANSFGWTADSTSISYKEEVGHEIYLYTVNVTTKIETKETVTK